MKKETKIGLILFVVLWTGVAGAYIEAPLAGTWLSDRLQFGVAPPGPVGPNVAQKWRVTTKAAFAGTDLTVDSCKAKVNGVQIGDPSLNAGYVEFESKVETGDLVELQIAEASYYTIVDSFTVPTLRPLEGGETYYTLHASIMYGLAHADATLSATYGGTDIDAANWDISAGVEYTGVTITLDASMANMDNNAYGPEKFTEIVGDKDTYSKFFKVDCNDSAVIIKNVRLEGVPLKMVWTTFAAGSDYQAIYEYEQMLVNDGQVTGDGLYRLTFSVTVENANNTIAWTVHVGRTDSTMGVDYESATVGSAGSADETVTITTE